MINQILKSVKQVNETVNSSGFSDLKTYIQSIQGISSYTVGTGGVLQYTVGYINSLNTIMTASSNNDTHCGKVVGIITETKNQSEQVDIQTNGEVTNTSWNLIPNNIYYLGLGGTITNIAPTSGFIQKIGVAKNANTLVVNIGQPIKLI